MLLVWYKLFEICWNLFYKSAMWLVFANVSCVHEKKCVHSLIVGYSILHMTISSCLVTAWSSNFSRLLFFCKSGSLLMVSSVSRFLLHLWSFSLFPNCLFYNWYPKNPITLSSLCSKYVICCLQCLELINDCFLLYI